MSKFNLIDEKWIPVRFPDGTRAELGIRETLLRSREIAAIEDTSPLVVAALHRFLLAILYRALEGPTDIEQAKKLLKEGLPAGQITTYLEKQRSRFYLFDEKYPFYQVSSYQPSQWRPWPAIAAEHNADNAEVLFDHTAIEGSGSIPSSAAARWLLACQTFALGGANSEFKYTKSAPSATAVMVIPLGITLHDTLILSLVPENRDILQSDLPVWEREPESPHVLKQGHARGITGWADLYTWRTRSIRFNFDQQEDGKTVRKLAFASGIECFSENHTDPMLGYRVDEKKGKLPVQFRERGLWRDFDSILPDNSHLAPLVIEHAVAVTRANRAQFPRAILVLGQANRQAKIKFWRMERFALPEALAGNRFVRTEIKKLLSDAEEAQKALGLACRSFAQSLLSRGDRKPDQKDIRGLVEQMPLNSFYWSTLETHFHEILHEYTLDRDYDDIRCKWLKFVRNTLQAAWKQYNAQVSTGDAWAIRALVKAEGAIYRKLKELKEEIQNLEQRKEEP